MYEKIHGKEKNRICDVLRLVLQNELARQEFQLEGTLPDLEDRCALRRNLLLFCAGAYKYVVNLKKLYGNHHQFG